MSLPRGEILHGAQSACRHYCGLTPPLFIIQTDLFLLAAQIDLAHIFKRYVTPFCHLFA